MPAHIMRDRSKHWPIIDNDDNKVIYGHVDIDEIDGEVDQIGMIPLPDGKHWLELIFVDEDQMLILADKFEYIKQEDVELPEVCTGCGTLVSQCATHSTKLCMECRFQEEIARTEISER